MKIIRLVIGFVALTILSLALSGCGVVGVQVWDRDILSKPQMQMDSPTLDRAIDDHIYFSKEASSGGRGFGGGGCGCN